MTGDTLHQPLGSESRADLSFTNAQLVSLRRVVSHFLPFEQRHWEESEQPTNHIFHDLVTVRWVLRQFDNDKKQERKRHEQLNEKTVRLSQG